MFRSSKANRPASVDAGLLPGCSADVDAAKRAEQPESLQQPDDDGDDDDDIKYVLYLSVHGYVGVDQPKQDTNDEQDDDNVNQ